MVDTGTRGLLIGVRGSKETHRTTKLIVSGGPRSGSSEDKRGLNPPSNKLVPGVRYFSNLLINKLVSGGCSVVDFTHLKIQSC